MVGEELERRKAAGQYNGSYSPVTHYFGYQGRCSHPSLFDCSLGSTLGFSAGVLVEHGLTGMCVGVRGLTNTACQWRVGAVPLVSMLRSEPKSGYLRQDLVVHSDPVDLMGEPYQKLKLLERSWRSIDHYSNPGPIQFYDEGGKLIAQTIKLLEGKYTKMNKEIEALCSAIQRDCLYIEHESLLIAALSSLQSAKSVINSMSHSHIAGSEL